MATLTQEMAAQIADAANQHQLDPAIVAAVVEQESAFAPVAYREEPAIEDASYGLMQLLSRTAAWLGYGGTPDGLYDVATNLRLGCQYLAWLLDRYHGEVKAMLAAYNAGQGTVDRGGWTANRTYVDAVLVRVPRLRTALSALLETPTPTPQRYQVVYGQRDPAWSAQRLGEGQGTIGLYGCYLTSYSTIAKRHGFDFDPPTLNGLFLSHHVYVEGNLLTDSALAQVCPGVQYVTTIPYETIAADLIKLKNLLEDPEVDVIVELDFDHDVANGVQTHFMPIDSCDGLMPVGADPWYEEIAPLAKNYGPDPGLVIQKYVVYRGPLPAPVSPPDPVPVDTAPPAEDSSGDVPPPPWDGLWRERDRIERDLRTEVTGLQQKVEGLSGDLANVQSDRDLNYRIKMAFESCLRGLEAIQQLAPGTTDSLIAIAEQTPTGQGGSA
jgi:hypothetical protein